jgi:RNA polymerase sigma-70 factor (ECF subfamily)
MRDKTPPGPQAFASDAMEYDRRRLVSLLQQTASGDQTAFSELHAVTFRKLRWAVTQVLGPHFDVDDVVQDAYLRIWKSGHRFDPRRSSPMTWMIVIARNAAIDRLRSRRQFAVPIEEALSVAQLPIDPFEDEDRASEVQVALSAMTKLSPERAELLSKAYLEGQSRAALARTYGAPESTIKTWIRRSLAELRQRLESDATERTARKVVKFAEATG